MKNKNYLIFIITLLFFNLSAMDVTNTSTTTFNDYVMTYLNDAKTRMQLGCEDNDINKYKQIAGDINLKELLLKSEAQKLLLQESQTKLSKELILKQRQNPEIRRILHQEEQIDKIRRDILEIFSKVILDGKEKGNDEIACFMIEEQLPKYYI